jgi:hypothetical protein
MTKGLIGRLLGPEEISASPDTRDSMGRPVGSRKTEVWLGREVQARIGQQLRAMYDQVVKEGVPPHIAKKAFEPLSQLRDPTLDERISLYLRAVHGNQDFGGEAYSDARNRILDAMAADLGEKLGFILPEQTPTEPVLLDSGGREVSQISVDLSFADAKDMLTVLGAPRAFEGPPPPASSLHSAEAMKRRVEAMMTRVGPAARDLPKSMTEAALRWSGDEAEARRLREDRTHHYIRFTFIAAIAVVIVCLIGMGLMLLH